jgi:hypothetical protein
MDYAVAILLVTIAIAGFSSVTGRAYQQRHTYWEEFWHSNGW